MIKLALTCLPVLLVLCAASCLALPAAAGSFEKAVELAMPTYQAVSEGQLELFLAGKVDEARTCQQLSQWILTMDQMIRSGWKWPG